MTNSPSPTVDLDALAGAPLTSSPFVWGTVRDSLCASALARLVAEFPQTGFTRTERRGAGPGQKGYRTDNLSLVRSGEAVAEGFARLTPLWRDLVTALMSAAYREAAGKLIAKNLSRAVPEIRAVRYSAGAWIDPHTDRTDKLLTQTWYFNDTWPAAHAGQFLVLHSPDMGDVEREVLPLAGESIVLCPSERSWHAVAPVSDSVTEDRKVLLLHLTAPE
ncbi:2OG-Fe(II) oxygenase [Streptomyces sp. NPDC101455]|uniref:2OG-Fe(II) oxygenase n=1 Tax=Streptomyces sp. NPDC101455 TaxID=3366142 RepID=UPI0038279A01